MPWDCGYKDVVTKLMSQHALRPPEGVDVCPKMAVKHATQDPVGEYLQNLTNTCAYARYLVLQCYALACDAACLSTIIKHMKNTPART